MGNVNMALKDIFKKKKKEAPKIIPQAKVDATLAKEKLEADKKGEPWVKVIELNLNPDDPSKGFIELDWNNDFVRYLKEHGYEGNDEEIVDEWLTELCRSIYANG